MKISDISELHYLTHIENLASITDKGILSHVLSREVPHQKIDMPEVQKKREGKPIPGGRQLHEYANLYFSARNPMLYKRKDRHTELCVLRVSIEVLDIPGVVIATGNAASDYVAFYPPHKGIECLNKELIFAEYWTDSDKIKEDKKRVAKCAEVLVPDRVPSKMILGVYVSCNEAKEKVKSLVPNLCVGFNPELFFIR
jgi:hypothetical protein